MVIRTVFVTVYKFCFQHNQRKQFVSNHYTGHYQTEFAEKVIIDLNNLSGLKSLELHVK